MQKLETVRKHLMGFWITVEEEEEEKGGKKVENILNKKDPFEKEKCKDINHNIRPKNIH